MQHDQCHVVLPREVLESTGDLVDRLPRSEGRPSTDELEVVDEHHLGPTTHGLGVVVHLLGHLPQRHPRLVLNREQGEVRGQLRHLGRSAELPGPVLDVTGGHLAVGSGQALGKRPGLHLQLEEDDGDCGVVQHHVARPPGLAHP